MMLVESYRGSMPSSTSGKAAEPEDPSAYG